MSAIDELISRLKETYREVRVLDGRDNAVAAATIRNCLAMANEVQRSAPAEEARSFILKEQRDTARHSLREARAEIARLSAEMSEPFACARQAEGGYVCQSDLDLDAVRADRTTFVQLSVKLVEALEAATDAALSEDHGVKMAALAHTREATREAQALL